MTRPSTAAVSMLLSCLLCACIDSPPPEGFVPPEGSVPSIDDPSVLVVRRDNPVLTGRISTEGLSWETTEADFPFSEEQRYLPDEVFVRADRAVFRGVTPAAWSDANNVWIDFPWPSSEPGSGIRADFVINHVFTSPAVHLPMRGGPVGLELWRRSGRTRTEPVDPGAIPPPIGFDDTLVGETRLQLDPQVLVIPVYVHVFAGPNGEMPHYGGGITGSTLARLVGRMLDPSAIDTVSVSLRDGPYDSVATTRMGRLADDVFMAPADPIWTQCDIQLQAAGYEVIRQEDGLETTLFTFDEFCSGTRVLCGGSTRLADFRRDRQDTDGGLPGLHLYVGGAITPGATCGGETFGVTCAGPCSAAVRNDSFIAIDLRAAATGRVREVVLAHEVGHFLGLGHQDRSCVSDWPDEPRSSNLMLAGSGGETVEGARLTPEQCALARQTAVEWLDRWHML